MSTEVNSIRLRTAKEYDAFLQGFEAGAKMALQHDQELVDEFLKLMRGENNEQTSDG